MKQFYKTFLTLFLVYAGFLSSQAYDFVVDGIYYQIIKGVENQVAVTIGTSKYKGDIVIPSSVTYNNVDYSVTSIGNHAFASCRSLTSVNIPASVTSIGNYAFDACISLTSVNIPVSVTSIGNHAFASCRSLTSVNVPASVTSIGNNTFLNCISLTSVNIPASVTSVGNWAFGYCSSLTSIDIPASVTSIGNYAFAYCRSLTSIDIPASVTLMGDAAFAYCAVLSEINVNVNNVYYASLGGVLFNKDLTEIICYPSGINIAEYIIPETVTSIRNHAFAYCRSLTSIIIPASVSSIGNWAFQFSRSLTSIIIPASVTSIGNYAFDDCSSLNEVTCLAKEVPSLGFSSFSTISEEATLYVYESVLGDYENSDRDKSFFQILPIETSGVESVIDRDMANSYKIYNLNGVNVLNTADKAHVQNLSKGLYIINGKKVMIGK